MTKITWNVAHVRLWLAAWWGQRHGQEVAAAYRQLVASNSPVLADLHRFCLADADTVDPERPDLTLVNQGMRRVWLHIQAMAGITGEDLLSLKKQTEVDDGDD